MPDGINQKRISVVTDILNANQRVAQENRKRFSGAGVCVIDLIGSPGSGKTALLEATIPLISDQLRIGVIEGDMSTSLDAERIASCNVPVVQITTNSFGGACHLEASTIRQALDDMALEDLDLLFVENVGNLVCPAEFDIGQNERVLVFSVAEGEDKPLKYPLAFREADLVVVNKMDLVPHLSTDLPAIRGNLKQINPQLEWKEVSARVGSGVDTWVEWVCSAVKNNRPTCSGC